MKKILISLGIMAAAVGILLGIRLPTISKPLTQDDINKVVQLQIQPLQQSISQLAVSSTPNETPVGATIPVAVARFESSLASKITSNATSMTLVSGTDSSGRALSGFTCFTIDEGTATVEDVCGTAAGTSVSAMIRGIDPVTGTSSVTSLEFEHRRGADVKITDSPQLLVISRILNGNETLPNIITYDSGVSSSSIASNLQNVASVAYVNSVATSGAPNASASAKGLVQAATGAQISISTSAGSTGALLFAPSNLYSSTSSATILVPVTQSNGKLAQGFLDLSQSWTFTGSVVHNATTTIAATSSAPLILNGISLALNASQTPFASSTLSSNASGTLAFVQLPTFEAATSTGLTGTTAVNGASATATSVSIVLPVASRLLTMGGVSVHTTNDTSGCSLGVTADATSLSGVADYRNGTTGAALYRFPLNFSYMTPVLSAGAHTIYLTFQNDNGGTNGTCTLDGLYYFQVMAIGN